MLLNFNITNITLWQESITCADCNCVRSLTAVSKMFHEDMHETYYASHDEYTVDVLPWEYWKTMNLTTS